MVRCGGCGAGLRCPGYAQPPCWAHPDVSDRAVGLVVEHLGDVPVVEVDNVGLRAYLADLTVLRPVLRDAVAEDAVDDQSLVVVGRALGGSGDRDVAPREIDGAGGVADEGEGARPNVDCRLFATR